MIVKMMMMMTCGRHSFLSHLFGCGYSLLLIDHQWTSNSLFVVLLGKWFIAEVYIDPVTSFAPKKEKWYHRRCSCSWGGYLHLLQTRSKNTSMWIDSWPSYCSWTSGIPLVMWEPGLNIPVFICCADGLWGSRVWGISEGAGPIPVRSVAFLNSLLRAETAFHSRKGDEFYPCQTLFFVERSRYPQYCSLLLVPLARRDRTRPPNVESFDGLVCWVGETKAHSSHLRTQERGMRSEHAEFESLFVTVWRNWIWHLPASACTEGWSCVLRSCAWMVSTTLLNLRLGPWKQTEQCFIVKKKTDRLSLARARAFDLNTW